MDGLLRLRAVTLILFLALLILATMEPKFCTGKFEIGCIESERQALLRFKQDLTDPTDRLASWAAADVDCCQWVGVVCHNVTGHVHELHLRSFPPSDDRFSIYDPLEAQYETYERSKFSGKVNPSLLDLKHLIYLDLSHNYFGRTQIPTFLGSMGSLRYLNLSGAGFRGLIPHQLGNLSNLVYLNVGDNQQFDLYVMNLQWLSGLPLLQHLDLSYANLGQASNWLHEINKLPSLSELRLSWCNIRSTPSIPSINFSSLTTLHLPGNFFYPSFPLWVFRLQNLVFLDLSEIDYFGPFPVGFQNLTFLRHLDLFYNHFNSSIPNYIYGLSHLEFLGLDSTGLQGTISSSIGNLTSAIIIELSNNALDGKLPKSLGNLCNLKEIYLSTNKWSQEISEIFEILSGCSSYGLEMLGLSDAQLSGHLTCELEKFKNLMWLSLGNNLISGSIPWSIGNLSSLRFLDLESNHFNGTLPQNLGQLSKLEQLHIASNMLEGIVSEVHFANLTRLKEIQASQNRMTLAVSHHWIPPFQLYTLYLGSWSLGPKFPPWLCSQRHLRMLDISNTGISDVVPPTFWNLFSQFNYLNFSHNKIYGEIPNIPMILSSGRIRIDMNSNHFKGLLPYISSNVSFLDLSNNLLFGSISHFLCYKMNEPKQMQYLNLRKNHLSGEINDCWMMWQSLSALNLGNNSFNGSILASFRFLVGLKYLHLDNNKFSQKLPSSLKNCTNLVIIDISKNEFAGSIPSWMGRFSSLVILSLRSNNFHGYIPKELCSLTSLQILDLSHNKLLGSIPRCVNNFSAMSLMPTYDKSNDHFVTYMEPIGSSPGTFESELVVIKGELLEYSTTLQLVKIIDLSDNSLSGEIPEELIILQGLQSLNLSFNILTRRIPENIGDMRSLESIDFSVNQLSGQVPQSMSSLTFLSRLNLSNNNLTGRIPSSTQLQSLDASSFFGNKLCGPPLTNNCTIKDVQPNTERKESKVFSGLSVDWFYVSMALGFVVGFWAVLGPLLLNKQWRVLYFQFLVQLEYKLRGVVVPTC